MLTKKEKERIKREIGIRVKGAVLLSGKSRRQLARALGVSHVAIKKYEDGKVLPKLSFLEKLSRQAGVSLDYFFRGSPALEVKERSLRSEKKIPEKLLKALSGKAVEFVERYLELESILGENSGPAASIEQRFPVREAEEAEKAAEELRRMWDLGTDPIEDLPKLLEERGFKLFVDALGEVESFLLKLKVLGSPGQEVVVIAVNKNRPGDRQWFSLAHELGHFFLELPQQMPRSLQEKIVNRFAGAFLAPRQRVLMELGSRRTRIFLSELYRLKQAYRLSMQGWIHRAEELGIISNSYAGRLRSAFRKKGWDRKEPGKQIPPIEPNRFTQLILRALSEGLISKSKAEALLGKSVEELEGELVQGNELETARLRD